MPARDSFVIFFHGMGASAAQLIPLATSWRGSLPNSRFAAPDAPFTHWRGHQWFRIDGNPLAPENIHAAREGFDQPSPKSFVEKGSRPNMSGSLSWESLKVPSLRSMGSHPDDGRSARLFRLRASLRQSKSRQAAARRPSFWSTARTTGRYHPWHQRWLPASLEPRVFTSKSISSRQSGIRSRRKVRRERCISCESRCLDGNPRVRRTFAENGKRTNTSGLDGARLPSTNLYTRGRHVPSPECTSRVAAGGTLYCRTLGRLNDKRKAVGLVPLGHPIDDGLGSDQACIRSLHHR